jgi:mono/diheme cytochrome c family protein
MNISFTATLGMLFALLGFAATFLMFHLWGYPFDKERRKSEAPVWARYLHRALGYLYAICYVILMWNMLPRMWEYQVEFPARTVAHLMLGFTIGFLLIVKISIMRFFRHFEEWMPYLGTGLLLCTVLLLGLSLPAAAQERALADRAFSSGNIARVRQVLPSAGLPEGTDFELLTTSASLARGRHVLLRKCVRCHDLKTILLKPRTPSDWFRTVERMTEKPALFDPLKESEMLAVTAYLVAITPDLQKSQKQLRKEDQEKARAMVAARASEIAAPELPPSADGDAGVPKAPDMKHFDVAETKALYEEECSLCHELSEVDNKPPTSREAIDDLIVRMIENDLELEEEDLEKVKFYLFKRFVDKSVE